MSLRGWLATVGLALCLSVPWGEQGASAEDSQHLTLTLPQARTLARRLLEEGNAQLSANVSAQILAAEPNDLASLLLRSAALTRSGRATDGLEPARHAFRLARVREARFEAAYLTAEAMAGAGRMTAAKLWLRRAEWFSPGEAESALLERAYRAVSAQSPLRFDLSLQAGPSDNVNGGSLHDRFVWFGIAFPISQALPGWTAGGTARLTYRLPGSTPAVERQLTASYTHRSVWFSAEAKARNPAADARDFSYDEVSVGGAVGRTRADGGLSLRASLQLGQRWQGGRTLGDVQRMDFGLLARTGKRSQAGINLGVEAAQYPATPRSNTLMTTLTGSVRVALAKAGLATFRLGYRVTDAEAIGVAYRGPTVSAEWEPPEWLEGVSLGAFAGAEVRDYWKTPSLDADVLLRGSVTASFERFSVMGVAPTVTLSANRSISDVVVRDRRDIGVSIGFASTF